MKVRPSMFVAALAAAASFAVAAENPVYDSWAKHKPGTRVVLSGTTTGAGMSTDLEQAYTLVEVTPEKAVVEVKNTMTMAGRRSEMPAQRVEILASAKPAPTTTGAEGGVEKRETKEDVTVAGKTYAATRTDANSNQGGAKTAASVWHSPDVPGTVVKMQTKTEGAMAIETKLEATTVELK